jgi:signal transduction histidine kinase/DNA-binding NarL/FixJ family response regulator
MQILLGVATALQVAAVAYCAMLLHRHRNAAAAWLCLLVTLLSMLVWRIVMTTGITPNAIFNTSIAIWGSVGAVLAMFFFGREIARREHAEAERDRLLASERAARSEAEWASRIKDDFMATLSHELRSPLAAMLGWCAIARKGDMSADVARAIETVERNARIQARLVDDLLDATRMQAGSLHLELAVVALDGPVLAAIEDVKPFAERKQLKLRFHCDATVPVVVGDASRLQQIASNLLVNAVKFSPDGKSITVSLASNGDRAELIIADEGIGIDPEFKPLLFQRFRQADSGNARRHGGVGLGLSIVSSLVQLHHGEVEARSDGVGKGATFVVRLPLATLDDQQAHAQPHALGPSSPSAVTLEGLRVIIVDDEADVRSAVAALLERGGATVLPMQSGTTIDQAIAEFRPDVLILDIGMPGEDGYSLIRRVRRLPMSLGGNLPAISLTAHAREEDRRRAMALGFQAHLAKPVNVSQLLSTIADLAAAHAAQASSAARASEMVPMSSETDTADRRGSNHSADRPPAPGQPDVECR